VRVPGQRLDVLLLGRLARRQVLLERPVHEVDPPGHRLAQHAAALQQVGQDDFR
jgi:hypothetical protein